MSWLDAKLECASRSNGWLVSITGSNMNTVVSNNRPSGAGYYWLGGTCGSNCVRKFNGGGIWVWESGEPWSYTQWVSGVPNIVVEDEACLLLLVSSGRDWNNTSCSNTFQYICQVLPILNKCPEGIY